jgi:hypothetical protein
MVVDMLPSSWAKPAHELEHEIPRSQGTKQINQNFHHLISRSVVQQVAEDTTDNGTSETSAYQHTGYDTKASTIRHSAHHTAD